MTDIFPPRNLPGDADNWAREVEKRVRNAEKAITQLQQLTGNQGRSFGGQLEVISRQLSELSERGMDSRPMPVIEVTGNATVAPFPSTVDSVTVSGRGDSARACLFGMTAFFSEAPSTGSVCYVEAIVGGQVVAERQVVNVSNLSSSQLSRGANFVFPLRVPAGGVQVSFRITRIGFTSTASTWTLQSGSWFVYYGDKVE